MTDRPVVPVFPLLLTKAAQSRLLLVLLLCCLLPACSSLSSHYQYQQLSSAELSAIELSDTPFFPQQQYHCGPAALATVLQVSGVQAANPDSLAQQVYLPERQGSLQAELLAASRRAERIPYVLAPQLTDLLVELAAGHPVLVLQNLGLARWPRWHYAVVIGFDPNKQQLLLRSGSRYRQSMSLRQFERSWQLADYWAMVVPAPGQLPATAEPWRYLQAVAAVEQQQRWLLAAEGYHAAERRWPGQATSAFGLGNIAYQQHDFAAAKAHYYRATELAPAEAAYYFNLSWALLRLGQSAEALRVAAITAQLAPDHPRYGKAIQLLEQAME
ncbi:PA2778 family cysteine peptidase [Alkalimonas amylolytica]|uniref:Peptidase_C39 like family protein n=1 Tax=Alkalimonas amylolytica TaxID=152573 RepID=A0A1H4G1W0_ALKAM|nr:PA2778 family cysteine peptidase [Alkalimonas amylolytica]SEB03616.1 Peptidase_C39 like family protein [Alkalimonas amylolytica]